MNNKDLFYFAAQCLALDEHPYFRETIISSFSSGEVNLDDFIFLCSNHFVLPALYLIFKKYNLLNIFPDYYIDHLEEIYKLNKKRNLEILQQINEINLALETENIIPVYLKGTANLLDNVYSDVGERMIGDIDLLVQDKDYLMTAELILNLGYKNDKFIYSDVTALKHYPRLYRTDVPADIEIHRVPVSIRYSRNFNTKLIFQNKEKIHDRINCFVPSNEHKVIINFIHSQLSNSWHRFKQVSLRNLHDLYLLSKRVDIYSVVNKTEEKSKIIIYFGLLSRIFNLKIDFVQNENSRTKRYYKSFNWLLNHPKKHHWFILIQKIFELIFFRLLAQPDKIIFQKSIRKGTFERITDLRWYRSFIYRTKIFYSNYIHRK
ncbi:MAG: nucleotidyltransferase family protein [Draconibacterium sp.]|nr:nucleotidyltransferase family protein [Draconibacterium sp.]